MPSLPHASKGRIAFAFLCVYLSWGATYGAIHIAVLHIAPALVGALRSVLSTVLFLAICLARRTSLRIPARTAWQLALVGVLFMSVNNVLLIWAESLVDSGYAALIIAMVPIFIALIEALLPGGETLNLFGWFGTALGALGMFALLWPSLHRSSGAIVSGRSLAGFIILILAGLSFAIGSVLARRFRFQVDTFVATTWQIAAAGVANLALATLGGDFHTAHYTRSGLAAIAFLSVVGSVIGLTAYTYLIQHVAVTKASTYAFVNPVIAVLLGVILFHETLGPAEITGMILILCAVAMVIFSHTRPSPQLALPLQPEG